MATVNGNGIEGVEATIALDAREHDKSVKREDYSRDGVFHFMFPFDYGLYGNRMATLPDAVPSYSQYAFQSARDIILLSTPKYEAMWASAIGIAVTKAAAWGFEIESPVALRRKRGQQVLLNSTAGVFTGWVHFLSAHLRSFLLTGKAFVEIERETTAYGSRIRALHHLNPLRCRVTDDPLIPIEYMDRRGNIHELKYWQVMLFADNLDPTEGEYAIVESSAERAYSRILLMAGITRYLYEKVTGKRALSMEFLPGLTPKQLENALLSAEDSQARKGNMMYMGAVVVPLPTETAVSRVTIPLAELPDGFQPQELRDDATVIYAGATGQDVNDLDPRLASRQTLGTGAQSVILMEKAKGKGLAAWRQQWLHNFNQWVLDDATTFAWSEQSLEDEEKKANIEKVRTETNKTRIETGMITADQGKNLLVDAGDLPAEFLEKDVTAAGVVSDDDKVLDKADAPEKDMEAAAGNEPPQPAEQPKTGDGKDDEEEEETKKERLARLDVAKLLQQEREAAARLAEAAGVTADEVAGADFFTVKHLGGDHNQQRHGWRFSGGMATIQRTSGRLEGNERETYQKRAMDRLSGVKPGKTKPTPKRAGVAKPAVVKPEPARPNTLGQKAKEARNSILAIEDKHAAKIKQLERKVAQAGGTRPDLNEKLNSLKQKSVEEMRQKLHVDNPADINAGIDQKIKGRDRQAAQDSIDGFNRLVDKSVVPDGTAVSFEKINGRAHYADDEVRLRSGAGATVGVHELGHWLEEKNPSLREKVHSFLDGRTKGDDTVSLSKATGNAYFGSNEVSRLDRFMNAYMGKQYVSGGRRYATEILSMGLELFYSDPAKLARQDPEYFDFIFAIVRGDGLSFKEMTFKHLGGQHNQKRHAWRFSGNEGGTSPARRSMRATPDKAEREEYKKRARAKLGLPERPVRGTGRRDEGAAVQPKVKKRGDIVREKIEAVGPKHEAEVAKKKAVWDREFAKYKELRAEADAAEKEYYRVKRTGGDDLAAGRLMGQKIQAANDQVSIVNNAHKEYESMKERVFGDYAKALQVDSPTSLDVTYERIGKGRQKEFDDLVDMVGGMVSREVLPDGSPVRISGKSGNRANYVDRLSQVNIKVGGPRTLAHELGHHIEHKAPGLYEKAKAFWEKRTTGEREVSLRSATGVNYGRGEWTKKDKWIHPYMGKTYRNSTELISMGIEYLLSEPMTLLRDDPEYFYFLIDVLQGG